MATAASLSAPTAHPRALHVGLWVTQILLALMFGMIGLNKAATPIEELALQMPVANEMSVALVRFIGISELAGAIGLVLPAATRIKPWLTPLAAAGLVVVMVLAALFHLVRGELPSIGINVVIGGLAAFVAWGRTKKAPILAR